MVMMMNLLPIERQDFVPPQLSSQGDGTVYVHFHHSLNGNANAWFLYRRESKSLKNKQPLQIKDFKSKLLLL